ncbi:uncharacterized protein Z519_04986 [Cladophialophora bantiana CBS 173.52]|uniref:Glycoside hydrolase family 5 domain-containing protein n=1 Tax=Cladophialophora bantiana (strain ATCC 10958 / CBS 173.52 / CDC B-1940 / NIH 8579) TaxID=1442370 RepID=A0A0D2EYI3_CLAB1|nr:uncharacterized protein Z519_04986 [Cladophialophora bantiana CBS 173.52]KIW95006.1 hypothetical protein Z519_04986 [Cladophialophora bantiana CBS 173.52]
MSSSPNYGFLRVQGDHIVDGSGRRVSLKGTSLGGWLCMENFMTGFPGTESAMRSALLQVLGKTDYEYFFDRFLYHFFTEKDAQFLKSLGFNCLRIPCSHKHLDDDMNPRFFVREGVGFRHLDRVINICANAGIYVVLELHTVPGCQNPDWHSDNNTSYAAFWDFKDHQDRLVWLWKELASIYKDNHWVAGYDPMNEPCDPQHLRLPLFYDRLIKEIRQVDPDHILFLEGNTFAMEWRGFEAIIDTPNCVYSIHDYATMGFPSAPGPYEGHQEQKEKLERQFRRKCNFLNKHSLPIWNSEFGCPWAQPNWDPDIEALDRKKYAMIDAQLEIYERADIAAWAIWSYKDIGVMGILNASRQSPLSKLVEQLGETKKQLHLDSALMYPNQEIEDAITPLIDWINKHAPNASHTYPTIWNTRTHVVRNVIHSFVANTFCEEYAQKFQGLSRNALEELAKSFAFDQCVQREELYSILKKYTLKN